MFGFYLTDIAKETAMVFLTPDNLTFFENLAKIANESGQADDMNNLLEALNRCEPHKAAKIEEASCVRLIAIIENLNTSLRISAAFRKTLQYLLFNIAQHPHLFARAVLQLSKFYEQSENETNTAVVDFKNLFVLYNTKISLELKSTVLFQLLGSRIPQSFNLGLHILTINFPTADLAFNAQIVRALTSAIPTEYKILQEFFEKKLKDHPLTPEFIDFIKKLADHYAGYLFATKPEEYEKIYAEKSEKLGVFTAEQVKNNPALIADFCNYSKKALHNKKTNSTFVTSFIEKGFELFPDDIKKEFNDCPALLLQYSLKNQPDSVKRQKIDERHEPLFDDDEDDTQHHNNNNKNKQTGPAFKQEHLPAWRKTVENTAAQIANYNVNQTKTVDTPVYPIQFQGQTLYLQEVLFSGDVFTALNIDRNAMVQELIKASKNEIVRKNLSAEVGEYWTNQYFDGQSTHPIITQVAEYFIQQTHAADEIPLFEREDVYRAYVEVLRNPGVGSYSSFIEYNRLTQKNICIWTPGPAQMILIPGQSSNPLAENAVHVLLKGNHYNGLMRVNYQPEDNNQNANNNNNSNNNNNNNNIYSL